MNDIIYADVPKDLTKIKTKLFFNLTKRQLVCFGSGALVGVPLYFLTRDALPRSVSMLLMIGTMTPFFLLALYEKNGQPLEKIAHYFIEARFRRSKKRPYKINNLYAAMHKQAVFDKEVKAIVRESVRGKKTAARRKA